MEYITAREAAEKWGITLRQAQHLCVEGRVPGAIRFNRSWAIPQDAEKPSDGRRRESGDGRQDETAGLLEFAPDRDHFLAKVVEAFPYAIALFTPDGTMTYGNEAYYKDFFITDRMQALGKLNLLRDELTRKCGLLEVVKGGLRGESYVTGEQKVPMVEVAKVAESGLSPTGIFYKSLIVFPIRDKGGNLEYMITVFVPTREYQGRDEFVNGKEYIETHWQESFDLNAAANASGLSRSRFVKAFREFADMTPYEYYQKVKINHMKEMLADPNLSVSQAFAACGVDYSGYYAKLFKQHVGETPLQYRKKHG